MAGHEKEPERHLPPPVLARKTKKSAKPTRRPWYRHTAWAIPLAACVLFAVLISGGLAVRQVFVLMTPQPQTVEEPMSPQPIANASLHASTEAPPVIDDPPPSLEPNEPGFEVLPPKAARQPGSKLRKMLLVGRHPDMFPTLESALAAALGGDIIEIRTNHPLGIDPAQAQWHHKAGPIVIRAGNGYAPVVTRRGGTKGPLLSFGYPNRKFATSVSVEGITFVDTFQPIDDKSALITSACDLTLHRCILCFNHAGVKLHYLSSPATKLHTEQSYFYAFQKSRDATAVNVGRGQLSLRNNLIYGAGRAMSAGGGVAADLPTQIDLLIEHNSLIACESTFFLYAKTNIACRDNLIAWRGHGYGLGAQVPNLQSAQARLNYRGTHNLYHQAAWKIWQGHVANNFAGWQQLTRNGEQNALLRDPLFAHPHLLPLAHSQLVPPDTFSLDADSPALAAASDRTQVGADLSQLPLPPAIAVWMIQHKIGPVPEN